MKLKSILIGSALLLPLAAFAANPFSGAFVGLEAGAQNVNYKLTEDGTYHVGAGSWAAGAFGGYNYALDDNWLIGAQVYYNYNNASISEDLSHGSGKLRLKTTYGVDALLGYAYSQSDAFYVGPGFVRGQYKASGTSSGHSLGSSSTWQNGWRGVAMAQQMLTDNLSLRESFAYEKFNKKSGASANIYSTMVGISYGFDI